jgi:c(7)-type cytochrome triheme protein
MKRTSWRRWLVVLTIAGFTGIGTSGELRRLPKDLALPQGEGSPGAVTFRHDSHVDADAPRCLDCHPTWFRILATGTRPAGEGLTHDAMEKGKACGACHGRTAFGFDDCTMCHAE